MAEAFDRKMDDLVNAANHIIGELNEQTRLARVKGNAIGGEKGNTLTTNRFRRMVLFKRQLTAALEHAGPLDMFEF